MLIKRYVLLIKDFTIYIFIVFQGRSKL